MKRSLAALALVALLFATPRPAAATVTALRSAPLAITGVTTASPIVVTTATNNLATNDWVLVIGVFGEPEANGIWQCSAVAATTCTLSGSVGTGTYQANTGQLIKLNVQATTTGAWFDVSGADRILIHVWSLAGSTSTVLVEQVGQQTAVGTPQSPAVPDPAFTTVTITNPSATGEYWSVPTATNVRVRVSAYTSGSIYANIEAYRGTTRIL